jgi:hypothetical protein
MAEQVILGIDLSCEIVITAGILRYWLQPASTAHVLVTRAGITSVSLGRMNANSQC